MMAAVSGEGRERVSLNNSSSSISSHGSPGRNTDKKRPAAMSPGSSSEESPPALKKRKIQLEDHSGSPPRYYRSPSKGKKPLSERINVNEQPRGIVLKSLRIVLHKLNIAEHSTIKCAISSTEKNSGVVGVKPVVNAAPKLQEPQPVSTVHVAKLCSHCSQWIEDFSRPHVCSPHYIGMRAVSAADLINIDRASRNSDLEETVLPTDGAANNIMDNADECDITTNTAESSIVSAGDIMDNTDECDITTNTAESSIVSAGDIESDSTVGSIETSVGASNILTVQSSSKLPQLLCTSVSASSSISEHQDGSSSTEEQKGKPLKSGCNSVQFCHRCHQQLNSKAHVCIDSSGQTQSKKKMVNPPGTIVEYSSQKLSEHYSTSHAGLFPTFKCLLCKKSIQTYYNLKMHYVAHMKNDTDKTNIQPLGQWTFPCLDCKDQTKENGNVANKSTKVNPKKVRVFVRNSNTQVFQCVQCDFEHPVLCMVEKHFLQKHNVSLDSFSSEEQAAQALHNPSLMESPSQKKNATPRIVASSTSGKTGECDSTTRDDMASVAGGLSAPGQMGIVDLMHKPMLLMRNDGKVIDESNLLMQSTTKSVPVLPESNSALQKTMTHRVMVPITGNRILIPANYNFEVLGVKIIDGKKQVIITLNEKQHVDSVNTTENNNESIDSHNAGAGKHSDKPKARMQLVQFKLASSYDGTRQPSSASQSAQQQNKNSDSSEVPGFIDLEATVSSSVEEVVTNKENQQDPDVTVVDNLTVPTSCKCKLSSVESQVKGAQVSDNPSSNAKIICDTRPDCLQVNNPTSQSSSENPSLTLVCAPEKDTVSDPPDVIDGPELPHEKGSPKPRCINNLGNTPTRQSTTVQVDAASVIKQAIPLSNDLKGICHEELQGCRGPLMLNKIDNADAGQKNVDEGIKLIVASDDVAVKVPNTPSSGIPEQLVEDCVEVPTGKSQSQIPIGQVANKAIQPLHAVTKLSSGEPVQQEECSPLDLTQPFLSQSHHEAIPCESQPQPTSVSVVPPALLPADALLSLNANENSALTCVSVLPEMPSQPFLEAVPEKSSKPLAPDLRIIPCNSSRAALTQAHPAGRPTTMQFALPPQVLDDLLKNPGSKVFIPVKGASKLSAAHFPFYVKLTNGRVMKIMPSLPKPVVSVTQEPATLQKSTNDNLHSLKSSSPQSPVIAQVNQNVTNTKVSPEVQKQCQALTQQPTNKSIQPAPLMLTKPNISTSCLPMPAHTTVVTADLPSTLSFQTLVGGQTAVVASTLGVSTSTPTITATANQMVPNSFIINSSLAQTMNQNPPIIFFAIGGNLGHQTASLENSMSNVIICRGMVSQNMPSVMYPVPCLHPVPGQTISVSSQKDDNLLGTNSNSTAQFPPPPPIFINTFPSAIANPGKLMGTQTIAQASNPEITNQHTFKVLTPLSGLDKGSGSIPPSHNLLMVTPPIGVSSKPSNTTSSQSESLVNTHLFGSNVLDSQNQTEISQHDRLSKSTAASTDPLLKDFVGPKLITEPMRSAECHEPEVHVVGDYCAGNQKDVGISIHRIGDLEVGKLAQTTTDTLTASVYSSIVQGEHDCKSPEKVPCKFQPNVVVSEMESSELCSDVNSADKALEIARHNLDLKAQLKQNKSVAGSKSEVHIDGQAKVDKAIQVLETEESRIPKTLSACEQLVPQVHISYDRGPVAISRKGQSPIETECAAATLMEPAESGELKSNTTHSTVDVEMETVDTLKSASDPKYILAPNTLASSITSICKGKPRPEPETQHYDLDLNTQGEPEHVANSDKVAALKTFADCSQLKSKAEETNSPQKRARFLPTSIPEGKEQFTKPTCTLKRKLDHPTLQTAIACSSMKLAQLPPPIPVKPLRLNQAHKRPETSQPVVVMNHPHVDPQEVVNLMRTVNMYPGCIVKVVLSRRTLAALEASFQEQALLKEILVSIAKSRKPRLGSQTTKEQQKMLAQRQGMLKMKLKRMSSNSYQVVHGAVPANTHTSQQTAFNCWFCGRVFSGQEEWVSHGQRHLSEWTRDWQKIFPSVDNKAANSSTPSI